MADFAKESGHFYLPDGTPFYEVIAKGSGKPRPVTLRDARPVGAYPGVTSIIRCAAAPALTNWMVEQAIMAALTLPRLDGEPDADYLARVKRDSQEQGKKAADRGTYIHGGVEKHFRAEIPDAEAFPWAMAARDILLDACGEQEWRPERSFACPVGYGGKIDLHSDEWVIDVKTKDGIDGKLDLYDEHAMQLAAYRNGLNRPNARCGILFLDRTEPVGKFIEAESEHLDQGLTMFNALLEYWQAKNKYRPV